MRYNRLGKLAFSGSGPSASSAMSNIQHRKLPQLPIMKDLRTAESARQSKDKPQLSRFVNTREYRRDNPVSIQDELTIIIVSYNPDSLLLLCRSIYGCLNQVGVRSKVIVSTVEGDPTINLVNALNEENVELAVCRLSRNSCKGGSARYTQLNEALKMVSTRYVSFFGSNDIIYPNKSYNEITKMAAEGSAACFSRYLLPTTDFTGKRRVSQSPPDKVSYASLLRWNYVSDFATIDLHELKEPLRLNYEKHGEACFWHLWLKLLRASQSNIAYNDEVAWEETGADTKSQGMAAPENAAELALRKNQKEFILSEFHSAVSPHSIFKYDTHGEKFWWWNDSSNTKPVEVTVALPALNASKIIWLALESLKNQTHISFAWELIVFEEEGVSKEIVKSYQGQLPGCVRIIYKTITRDDAYYEIEDIEANKCTSYYTLLEKWINMAKIADKDSKVFVKHAVDCYSSPKRLHIHYEHFKQPMCCYSTQPKGYFYHVRLDKYFMYDGAIIEPYNWEMYYQRRKLPYKKVEYDSSIPFRGCHLNMALRTDVMRQVALPPEPLRSGLDGYILYCITQITNVSPEDEKIIFTDDEVDSDNWKYSLDTDGYNNITVTRQAAYFSHDTKSKPHCIPTSADACELEVPKYIMDRFNRMRQQEL